MKAHATQVHGIGVEEEGNASFSTNQTTLKSFLTIIFVTVAIAKMVCKDGLSFNQIDTSEFIQSSLATNGYDKMPPTTGNGVKKLVFNYYLTKRKELSEYFECQIKVGNRFSISLDEYTSSQNFRYMNINVHDATKHWSLGLIPIQGSLTSKRIT